jgi:ribosome-associated protein
LPRIPAPKEALTDVRARAAVAAIAATDKKAGDVLALDVGDIISITEVFVIAGAPNVRQVRTIVDEIEEALKEHAQATPRSVEGLDDASWVLMDYGDLVVHIFLDETREYYQLERLWADAPRVDWVQAQVAAR